MLALSLSDNFCCFGIFVFNRFLFSRFCFVLVFVNENHTHQWTAARRYMYSTLRRLLSIDELTSVTSVLGRADEVGVFT